MDPALISAQFDYGYWVTDRILSAAAGLTDQEFRSSPASARDLRATLVHSLDTEWSWRLRLQGQPEAIWKVEMKPEEFPDVDTLRARWEEDRGAMLRWLQSFSREELTTPVDLGEESRGYPLWYYLLHIIHHSSQCRADAAAALTDLGRSPGDLDFLDYADSR